MNTEPAIRALEELLLEGADFGPSRLGALEPLGGAACREPGGLLLYGHLCLLSGRPAQALRCYRDVLEPEPGHPGARLGRLVALDHLGARTPDDTRQAEATFRAAGETDRRLLAPLASAPLRRAAWISVGTHLAAVLERRVAGQEEGRARLVETVTARVEGGAGGRAPVVALVGPEGTGKATAVRTLARTLLREERVAALRADDPPPPAGFDAPALVLVDGFGATRPDGLDLVSRLARHPGVVLVALRVSTADASERRPVGFGGAPSPTADLAGRLGARLAAVVDAEIPFPALDEATARTAVALSWREAGWPLAAELGGWANLAGPDLDAVFRAAWNGSGLPGLREEMATRSKSVGI
jgi:hypothetical protein